MFKPFAADCMFVYWLTLNVPSNTFYQGGKAATCCTACPPSPTRFHQPHRTTTVSNGQPARCIQGQVAMATESTCYAECLLPSRHRVHHRRNSQPSLWPACLSTNVIPGSYSDTYTGEEFWIKTPTLISVWCFSLFLSVSPTLTLLSPSPLHLILPSLKYWGEKKSKQQQTNHMFLVVSGGGRWVLSLSSPLLEGWETFVHPAQNVDDASRAAGQLGVQVCAVAPCYRLILENMSWLFVFPIQIIKA